ncbi:ribosomal RNA processing protein [Coprinopsis marcescibilis]|uniref:Ribosomal RNA processing protein n=1 Tax=Coprinopsis marcescibilis TaxID=230819 RepID=A0A5C3LDP2_COPMA|nr:ribosomal RNA processing protein [Coprinopsis marcescibilis]
MASTSPTPTNLPLGKVLASTEKKTRDKAIKNLSIFLSQSGENAIPKPEMDKLWKGIFYCFWMSDKPLVQQALASELAELLLSIPSNAESLAFLLGFWETLVREWNGIDRLRMDKYYMLVRRFVNASFRLMLRAKWDKKTLEQYNEILTRQGGPLCHTDTKVPTSLAYHLADIYLEELEKVLAQQSDIDKQPPVPLILVLNPFLVLATQTASKITFRRIQSALLQPLLDSLSLESGSDDEDEARPRKRARLSQNIPIWHNRSCLRDSATEKPLPRDVLQKQIRRALFDCASRPDTRDSSRRKLYALWKEGEGSEEDD